MKTTPRISRKPQRELAIKKSVSMPQWMFNEAETRAHSMGFGQFSDFLQHVLRKELRAQGA